MPPSANVTVWLLITSLFVPSVIVQASFVGDASPSLPLLAAVIRPSASTVILAKVYDPAPTAVDCSSEAPTALAAISVAVMPSVGTVILTSVSLPAASSVSAALAVLVETKLSPSLWVMLVPSSFMVCPVAPPVPLDAAVIRPSASTVMFAAV